MKKRGRFKNRFKKNQILFLILIILSGVVIISVLSVKSGFIFGKKVFLDDSKKSLNEILNEINLDEIETGTLPTLPPSLGTPPSFDIDSCFEDPHVFTAAKSKSSSLTHDGCHKSEAECAKASFELDGRIDREKEKIIKEAYMEALSNIYDQESEEHTRHLNNGDILCSGLPAPPPEKWEHFFSAFKYDGPHYSTVPCKKDGEVYIARNLDYFFEQDGSMISTGEWTGSTAIKSHEMKCKTSPDCSTHCDIKINADVFLKLSHSYYYTTSSDDSLKFSSASDDSSGTLSASDGNLEF